MPLYAFIPTPKPQLYAFTTQPQPLTTNTFSRSSYNKHIDSVNVDSMSVRVLYVKYNYYMIKSKNTKVMPN